MDVKLKQSSRIAKIALFFADCDGNIAPEEKAVIENLKKQLKQESIITGSSDEAFYDLEVSQKLILLEDVIKETKLVLAEEDDKMSQPILNLLEGVIESVILADGVVTSDESANFTEWRKRFNLIA